MLAEILVAFLAGLIIGGAFITWLGHRIANGAQSDLEGNAKDFSEHFDKEDK